MEEEHYGDMNTEDINIPMGEWPFQAPWEFRESIPINIPIQMRPTPHPIPVVASPEMEDDSETPSENQDGFFPYSNEMEAPPAIEDESETPSENQYGSFQYQKDGAAPRGICEGMSEDDDLRPQRDFRPKMQKVPSKLRQENNQQVYEPLVVSFGPYHHGKEELQLAEEFKPKALELFVQDSGMNERLFYDVVFENIDRARSCYIDGSTYQHDDQRFARMMLLDASFIINYIRVPQFIPQNHIMLNYLGKWRCGQVIRDMLLLENQIPFFILKRLTCAAYGKNKGEKLLNKFLNRNTFLSRKPVGIASSEGGHYHPLHLLAAYRLTFLNEQADVVKQSSRPRTALAKYPTEFRRSTMSTQQADDDDDENGNYPERKFIQSFRSVTDLKAKGIHFRPSTADSITSLEFKSGYVCAQLIVPVTIVGVHTKVIFSNMIAYEMSEKTNIKTEVTTYIDFMKKLIDNPKDVKELREKKIVCSFLSSDEDVVKVFKEIGPYGLYYSKRFQDVKENIQNHCDNKVKIWLAEFIYTHFRTPWTVAAFVGALALLILGCLQTYYSSKPS